MCLLVLGMHRSGTSALTRVLSIAGARLPASLLGPGPGNELGHWESIAIARYDDELLAQLGSRWGDWRALDFNQLSVRRQREIRSELAGLVASEYGEAPLFVVKDPRICRFAPFFIVSLEEAGIETRSVHVVRNPLEVADSLKRRDNMTRTDAALQWLRHVLDSEAATRERSRVIVTYASLMQDWRATLERITSALRIAWPHDVDDIAPQVAQFLDHERRHHSRTVEEVLLDPALREWMGEAYSALLVLESNPASRTATATLDAIRREFNHAGPLLDELIADTRGTAERQHALVLADRDKEKSVLVAALAEVNRKIADREARIGELDVAIAAASAESARLAAALVEHESKLSELAAAHASGANEIGRLSATLADRDAKLAELAAARDAALAEARELAAKLRESDGRIAKIGISLAGSQGELRALRTRLANREAACVELERTEIARSAQVKRLTAELAERERSLAERDGELARLRAALVASDRETEIAGLRASIIAAERTAAEMRLSSEEIALRHEAERHELLDQATAERQQLAAHFRASNSWKVTGPLRALRRTVSGLRRARRQPQKDEATVIAESGLFDAAYYRVLASGEDIGGEPIRHYLQQGSKRGLEPNPLFDTDFYRSRYDSQLDEGANPLVHFIRVGARLRFDPSRLFDTAYYLRANPDVEADGINPLLHYLRMGRIEGRLPLDIDPERLSPDAIRLHRLDLANPESDRFDAELYGTLYPDAYAEAHGDEAALRRHFETFGRADVRTGSPAAFLKAASMPPEAVPLDFHESEYYALNADLEGAMPATFFHALRHYLHFGIHEHRRYSYAQCYAAPRQAACETPAFESTRVRTAGARLGCLVAIMHPVALPAVRRLAPVAALTDEVIVGISESVWSEALHAQIRSEMPRAGIVITATNAGDVGAYAAALEGVPIDEYAAFILAPSTAVFGHANVASENDREAIALLRAALTASLTQLRTDPGLGATVLGDADAHGSGSHNRVLVVRSQVLKQLCDLCRMMPMAAGNGAGGGDTLELVARVCAAAGRRVHAGEGRGP